MICPECKNEIGEGISVCPNCGFDVNADKWECEECHTFVDNNTDVCPTCGASKKIAVQGEPPIAFKQQGGENSKKIGLAMIIAACILCVVGFTRITNSHYRFYKQHYAECEAGYVDTKSTANSYKSGFFKNSYNEIASSYKSLMDDDMKKINSFRIQAGVCWVAGVGLLVVGLKKRKG